MSNLITRKLIRRPSKEGDPSEIIVLLVGENGAALRKLSTFQALSSVLRETFPDAKDDDIVGDVTSSDTGISGSIPGHSFSSGETYVSWEAAVPAGEYPGWEQVEKPGFYVW